MKKGWILLYYLFFSSFILFSYEEEGVASWYGPAFHGKKTANGEIFNTNSYTAAHKTLPFNSILKVISLENGKYTFVRINDRGPFVSDRIIDLSFVAATELDMIKKGTMKVKIILVQKGDNKYYKFSNNEKYKIQIASFSSLDKAYEFINKFKEFINSLDIEEANIGKKVYRVIIDNLNYFEYQSTRVCLHKLGIDEYISKRKSYKNFGRK